MSSTDASYTHPADGPATAAPLDSTNPPDRATDPARSGGGGRARAHRRYDSEAVEPVRRLWWVLLVAGILWTLYGTLVLTLRPDTVASLAILAGISFILGGVSQFMLAARIRDNWRWLFVVGGLLGIAAGVVAFVWPGMTLLVLAIFIAWYLVVSGIFSVVAALVGPKWDWWWVGLVVGLLQFGLGIWAIGSPGRELLLLVNLVGVSMVFYGVSEIFAAFALRAGELPVLPGDELLDPGRPLTHPSA
jgi:uncharacterized membrane protein HdeD (DUF308 family)